MIVGLYVNHDNKNQNKSYGALIASINDSHTKFYSNVQSYHAEKDYFAVSMTSIFYHLLLMCKLLMKKLINNT